MTMSAKEYVVWGTPPGSSDEYPLFARDPQGRILRDRQAANLQAKAARDRGATKVRIQVIDGSIPDFVGAIARKTRRAANGQFA
jgi:hypothetical protein